MRFVWSGLIFCCLLCSCSFSRTVETDEAGIMAHYRDLSQADFRAEVSAEFPDRVSTYLLDYGYRRDGKDTVTVVEPQSIAGVTVTVENGEAVLQAGETKLSTGEFDDTGLSPVSVLPRLVEAWTTTPREVEAYRADAEACLLLIYEDGDVSYRTLFSRKDYTPVSAEVFSEGNCVLRVKFVT